MKGWEGLTWLVEGNWLTSAMKFMTKGVAGRSKISLGVPTCSMCPLQYECKPRIKLTTYIHSVHIWIHCMVIMFDIRSKDAASLGYRVDYS